MKKKILAIAMVVAVLATAIVGMTLAYFTDTDRETNVFTTGNVQIDLWENFTQESELIPATGSAQDGTLQNGVEKEVFVTNTGSMDAYVRVHIAIPAVLDNPDNAGMNVLHFNYRSESVAEGLWNWSTDLDANDWNFYTTTIDGIEYNVYVVTYESILAPDADTVDAMHQVYLDGRTTQEQIADINEVLGENWKMYVVAEGTQAAGFGDAYEALNASFGVPGFYAVQWIAQP